MMNPRPPSRSQLEALAAAARAYRTAERERRKAEELWLQEADTPNAAEWAVAFRIAEIRAKEALDTLFDLIEMIYPEERLPPL